MRQKRDIYDVLLMVLVVVIIVCTFAQVAMTESPLAGSHVLTLERGPDGLWINQAWILELHVRPEAYVTLVYDVAKISKALPDWDLIHRQWDLSATYQRLAFDRLSWGITIGRRWSGEDTGSSLGGAGPWVYGVLMIGF